LIIKLKKSKINKALQEIKKIADNSPPVKIKASEFNCLKMTDDKRFLVLNVERTSSLLSFSSKIHKALSEKKISTISNYAEWRFHVTIVNNHFVQNPISESDFKDLCIFLEGSDTESYSYADKVEAWRPVLNPSLKTIKSIKLPNGE
jgi:2'-5' RNA ligase